MDSLIKIMLQKHLLFGEGDDFSGELKHTHVSDDVEKYRQTNLLEKLQPYQELIRGQCEL